MKIFDLTGKVAIITGGNHCCRWRTNFGDLTRFKEVWGLPHA